jgi:single-strand DNA-binding protein
LWSFKTMNSCVLMAEIGSEPQLRYTQEAQLAVTEMMVQFPPLRAEDKPGTIKVIGWGNLAEQLQSQFSVGDRVVIEGRLGMNTIERDGFKEKRAELTATRMHVIGQDTPMDAPAVATTPVATQSVASAPATPVPAAEPPVEADVASPEPVGAAAKPAAKAAAKTKVAAAPAPMPETNYDDIPF